ncbi:hypothetical protein [Bradyrhizobium sp. S3.7.6]
MTIVKVQVPLFSSAANAPALIYEEARTRVSTQYLDGKTRAAMADDLKAYFEAIWTGDHWQLGKRVEFQAW